MSQNMRFLTYFLNKGVKKMKSELQETNEAF